MIDFRYHIISIVAVLLALSIGIITGSAFLGGPLLQQLENRVDSLERKNDDLLARVRETEREANHQESALSAFESTLTNGALSGRRIVLWQVGETEADTVDAVRASLEEADGEIATTVVATDQFDLGDLAEREDLTTTLDLPDVTAADLRVDIAELIGSPRERWRRKVRSRPPSGVMGCKLACKRSSSLCAIWATSRSR